MSGISSTYLLQRSDDGILSLMLCVRDGYPNGRRHFSGSVFGGNLLPQKYSPTRRDDFVRGDSSGARPERTLGGEGRGWYAGASAYGLHSQYAQNGGWSYGGQEQVYLGYGNNTGKQGADGKTGSVVSAELWLPTLGKYGHFAFGETYDVSGEGSRKQQIAVILKIIGEKNRSLYENIKKNGFTLDNVKSLQLFLLMDGYETVDHYNGHEEGSVKTTYRPKGSWGYGNIEFISKENTSKPYVYSSYNYGNNYFSHFIIDFIGYKGRDSK